MAYISKWRLQNNTVVPIGSNLLGNCSTAGGTATKVVAMSDFNTLVEGVTIHVHFQYENTANSAMLQVGSTQARPVRYNGTQNGAWASDSIVSFTYYSGAWCQNDYQTDGGGGGGSTYGLSFDSTTNELSLVPDGQTQSVTLPNGITYSLSISDHTVTLTGSDGSTSSVTVPDNDTKYMLTKDGDDIVLIGTDGERTYAVDNDTKYQLTSDFRTVTHSLYVNIDGVGYDPYEDNFVTDNYGENYLVGSHEVYIVDSNGLDISDISVVNLCNFDISEAYSFGQALFSYFGNYGSYRLKIDGELTQIITRSGVQGGNHPQILPPYDYVIAEDWWHDGVDTCGVFATGVVIDVHNRIDLIGSDGTTTSVPLKAIDIGALPTAMWHVNDKDRDGYVPAPNGANKVWKTDANGNPKWLSEIAPGVYTLSKSGSTITLTGSDGSTTSVTDDDTILQYTEDAPDVGTATNNVVQNDVSGNTASGGYALAEGQGTTASGERSHAEGYESVASGSSSHAEGLSTEASGNHSHAEGNESIASGSGSHAEGTHTEASGNFSHSTNLGTIAQRAAQTAIGKWNEADTAGADETELGDYALIIGNGDNDSTRSNALTVDWSGNVETGGGVTIDSDNLDITQTTAPSSTQTGNKLIFADANDELFADIRPLHHSNGAVQFVSRVRREISGTAYENSFVIGVDASGNPVYWVPDKAKFRSDMGISSADNLTTGTLPVARLPVLFKTTETESSATSLNYNTGKTITVTIPAQSGYELVGVVGVSTNHAYATSIGGFNVSNPTNRTVIVAVTNRNTTASGNFTDLKVKVWCLWARSNIY